MANLHEERQKYGFMISDCSNSYAFLHCLVKKVLVLNDLSSNRPFVYRNIRIFASSKFLECEEEERLLLTKITIMLQEKAGEIAGKIWQALNENGQLSGKELKKVTKVKSEKDLYLGLGWLLREDKVQTAETEKDIIVSLK